MTVEYEIIVGGHLDDGWVEDFDGLTLARLPDGTTRIHGLLPDQAALHGLLSRIRDWGLELIRVRRVAKS